MATSPSRRGVLVGLTQEMPDGENPPPTPPLLEEPEGLPYNQDLRINAMDRGDSCADRGVRSWDCPYTRTRYERYFA